MRYLMAGKYRKSGRLAKGNRRCHRGAPHREERRGPRCGGGAGAPHRGAERISHQLWPIVSARPRIHPSLLKLRLTGMKKSTKKTPKNKKRLHALVNAQLKLDS